MTRVSVAEKNNIFILLAILNVYAMKGLSFSF